MYPEKEFSTRFPTKSIFPRRCVADSSRCVLFVLRSRRKLSEKMIGKPIEWTRIRSFFPVKRSSNSFREILALLESLILTPLECAVGHFPLPASSDSFSFRYFVSKPQRGAMNDQLGNSLAFIERRRPLPIRTTIEVKPCPTAAPCRGNSPFFLALFRLASEKEEKQYFRYSGKQNCLTSRSLDHPNTE